MDALRHTQGPSAVISDAFRVVVDGFTAAQVGVTSPASTLEVASPATGMNVTCTGNYASSGGYGSQTQRFTFFYNLDFGTNTADPAFGFSGATKFFTLNVTAGGASAAGRIELIKHDGQRLHPAGRAGYLTQGNGTAAGQSFGDPGVLPPDEEGSALFLTPEDDNHIRVFNFALARVRYIGLIGATSVRVFLRLFSAQQTTSICDYPPGEQYRRATNPDGQPIPLAGVIEGEYVTIPCFALPRVDSAAVSMDQQTDSRVDGLGNTKSTEWRKVIGAFQLSIPVSQRAELLVPEERQLSVLRWIARLSRLRAAGSPYFTAISP